MGKSKSAGRTKLSKWDLSIAIIHYMLSGNVPLNRRDFVMFISILI